MCQNGATCVGYIGGYNCECPPDFTGRYCDTNIEDCFPNPCLNYGTCDNMDGGGYNCTCIPYFTGNNCETRKLC